jgi:transmembrane sensor
MTKPRADDIRIATEAARWQHALAGGSATESERAEFADWVKASPRHLREYLFAEALDSAASDVDPDRKMDIDLAVAADASNVTLLSRHEIPRSAGRRFAWLAAAASVAALALAWWARPDLLGGWRRYDTGIGEQRSVQLPDGSVMQLNTDSRARVRFSGGARKVRLLRGQVFFKVARDAQRTFSVEAGDAVVRVLGTQFDVYHRDGATKVAVVEGRVEISAVPGKPSAGVAGQVKITEPTQLGRGEAARVAASGSSIARTDTDITTATAWQQRRLVFDEESLGHIVEEFNRYNLSPRLVIQDESLEQRRIGGTFDADDPESLVSFILLGGDLEVERKGGSLLVRRRRASD